MDKIEAKVIQTMYGHEDLCILVNKISLDMYLDKYINDVDMKGFYPAWGNALHSKMESKMIWEMVHMYDQLINVPILVCPEDLDLSCSVIVAQIIKEDDVVYWKKIGICSFEKYSLEEDIHSGILKKEAWSDEDWKKYGKIFANSSITDPKWNEWISQNWEEEEYRRLINYTKPFLQKEENIKWFDDMHFSFEFESYKKCIEIFEKEL